MTTSKNCRGKEKGITECKKYNLVLKHLMSYQWVLLKGPEGIVVEQSEWKSYFRRMETGTKIWVRKIHYKYAIHYK